MNDTVNRATFDKVMVPNYGPSAIIPDRGEGVRIWDTEGREYIDFAGGIAVNCLGHCHPAVVSALKAQADKLWHLSNVFTNEPALELAVKLTENTFADRVFFCNSGGEANEAAFKMVRKYAHDNFGPDKSEIISFNHAFHGRTLFTVCVGGQPKYTQGFEPLPGGLTHLPFNDLDALEAAISDNTCAVVIEPIQGEGGIIPADPAFLEGVRALCDKHNALLVFDEVQTGMGRTGKLYAYMNSGVVPDVLTSAKALGGGFPIGAMLTTDKIAASMGIGSHGSTYGGNPLACAVGNAVFDLVNDDQLMADVRDKFEYFRSRLMAIGEKYGVFSEVRGAGLLVGAVLADAWQGKAKDFLRAAVGEGLMVLVAGANVVRMAPSLLITEAEMDEGLQRFEKAVAGLVGK